eukprot:661080-Amphidinium_carterae.1
MSRRPKAGAASSPRPMISQGSCTYGNVPATESVRRQPQPTPAASTRGSQTQSRTFTQSPSSDLFNFLDRNHDGVITR